ncbi:unnamed protein product [Camellia sinensis]
MLHTCLSRNGLSCSKHDPLVSKGASLRYKARGLSWASLNGSPLTLSCVVLLSNVYQLLLNLKACSLFSNVGYSCGANRVQRSGPSHRGVHGVLSPMILDKGQLLETEQMFRDAGEQWPVIIPEEEIRQAAPGTKLIVQYYLPKEIPKLAKKDTGLQYVFGQGKQKRRSSNCI